MSMASISSANSFPAKPAQKNVSASTPGSMPKPRMLTNRMAQIISCTARKPIVIRRATG